jgi:tubulin monoglycylase TTLL15
MFFRSKLSMLILLGLFIGLFITAYNIWQLGNLQKQYIQGSVGQQAAFGSNQPSTYTLFAKHPDTGYLKHVLAVLERGGYSRVDINASSDWDVLWAHDYPFKKIRDKMLRLKPGQKVNKFPGSGYITNKVRKGRAAEVTIFQVNLATSGLKNVPPAFSLPGDKDKLLAYAKSHPEKMFVQKSNNHRGIQIEKLENLKLDAEGSFIQEFIHNPLLVNGFKFDIGLYVTLTSVDPLRIYVHQSDVLLRFCSEKYHPFDSADKDKYVVGDDYLPSWQVPSFSKYMDSKVGFSFKDTLNAHIKSLGKDPDTMWNDIYETISDVYRSQEEHFVKAVSHYPHKDAFFEMVRFDFVIDDQLKVYLMEANMSPNLSSAHFPANALLYEQVVHSLMRLVGVVGKSVAHLGVTKEEQQMEVQNKDLLVNPESCSSTECTVASSAACSLSQCELCLGCLSAVDLDSLRGAWLERKNQFATARIFPPPVSRTAPVAAGLEGSNRRMAAWYRGKCLMDSSWCDL